MISQSIKPSECVLGFGVPVTEKAFRQSLKDPKRDFASLFPSWSRYEAEWISDLNAVMPDLRKWGVRVLEEVTLASFAIQVSTQPAATILFSHTRGGAIEMADGMNSPETLVELVPCDYTGTLDLAACGPVDLVAALIRRRPLCRFRYVVEDTTPLYWVHFYHLVFWLLQTRTLTYQQAVEQAIDALVGRKVAGC